jgi:hypothetical protein
MTDLYKKIVEDRSGLEQILAKIPGFRGYTEMSARRAADRMIRDYVVKLLKEQMTRFVSTQKKIIGSGGIKYASKSKTAQTRWQIFIDKVNTAMPGYSGFYDAKKVSADDIDKLYQFDAALVSYVDKFSEGVDALQAAAEKKDGIDTAIIGLESAADEAIAAYGLREDVITGLSKA